MRTLGAALAGALVAGVIMFAVGTRAAEDSMVGRSAPTAQPEMVGQMPGAQPYGIAQPYAVGQPVMAGTVLVAQPAYIVQPAPAGYAAAQSVMYTRPAPVRTAARPRVVRERVVSTDEMVTSEPLEVRRDSNRSWAKTALIIGGSSATGAGVGAIAGGRKGALIGAAIGGGAASIFEAAKRH